MPPDLRSWGHKNVLDLEINTDEYIKLLFLTENHLYESFGLILIHLNFLDKMSDTIPLISKGGIKK